MEKLAEGYSLIEGPVWDPQRGLIFSDVLKGGVFCLDSDGVVSAVFEHRRGIGGMARHAVDGMVVSGRNISFKPFAPGDTVLLLDRDEANSNVGYNDITTDGKGRIYAGSLGSSPVFDDGREPHAGDLYLIDLDGSARVVAEDVLLTNGLGLSPDGRTLYHSDTGRQTVFCYSVDSDGSLGEKRPFVSSDRGGPDGLVVSEDGAVWVALAGGNGVGVYAADGSLREHIEIPLPMCTSVCFGGEDLKDLYIVSGSDGAGSDTAGAVFKCRTEVAGLPVPQAKVSLGGGSGA
jgi:gluconolactonase|tara:strand:+ start:1856 stop:2725 length:870 start_codon:yes stop_codon:yes gene_type:complete